MKRRNIYKTAAIIIIIICIFLLKWGFPELRENIYPDYVPENATFSPDGERIRFLKAMTYNIHSGEGMDGKYDINRIVEVIQVSGADIIGLNEVHRMTDISSGTDQAKIIAESLGYNYCFGETMKYRGGTFGNALVTRYPIISYEVHILPEPEFFKAEPRCFLECVLDVNGKRINVLVTHMGLTFDERITAVKYIADVVKSLKGPIILMGDFNVESGTIELAPLVEVLKDCAIELDENTNIKTFRTDRKTQRIDYIFVSIDLLPMEVGIIDSVASDHVPFFACLNVKLK